MPYTKRKRSSSSATPTYQQFYGSGSPRNNTRPKPRAMVVPGLTRRVGFYQSRARASEELKFKDVDIALLADITAETSILASSGLLNLIAQGTGESQRIGRKCTIKSISLKGNYRLQPAESAPEFASSMFYLYILLDTQCNGTLATWGNVFNSTNAAKGHFNLKNQGRFKLLCKKVIELASSASGALDTYGNRERNLEIYKRVNIPIEFSGVTGALTEVRSNNIFFAWGSGSGGDDILRFDGQARVRFVG